MSFESDYNRERKSIDLPDQMASSKIKQTKGWQEKSVDYYVSQLATSSNSIRKSVSEMDENIRLMNSTLNVEDLREAFDPLGLNENENNENLPIKEQFYNIINNPLRTLFGEELKRRSDIRAVVTNQLAINKKDKEFEERLFGFLSETAKQESIDEEDFQKNLQELDRFKKHDLQSAHEKMANEIIQVMSNNRVMNIKRKFNKGFESLNTIAEEVFRIGHIGKEPWFFNVDSRNFRVYGLGESNYIHDGNAWVEWEYLSPNKIIEEFNRELTKTEIKNLLDENSSLYNNHITPITASSIIDDEIVMGGNENSVAENGRLFTMDADGNSSDSWINEDGDIRVVRVQWLSLRKIGELKYYDEYGDEQRMFVDEYYPVDETLGQEVEWFYINELWEGTKIGSDIYKNVKPVDIQMRSIINPAMVRPTYVGVINSFMGGKARCVVDEVKPYQHDFNVWMLKLKQLWIQHIGKAAVIDMSRIPSHMDTTEWFRWLRTFGIAFENPFEESNKGQLAGYMQQNSRNIDLSHAEDINQAVQMLSYYEQMINKIAAVPEARQGDLRGNEGLGVTQEANVRSSTQTESVFQMHEDVKAFSYEILIEYAKVLWKDEKIKRQYQLDDLSNYIIDIDGAELNEAEYGVQITNSSKLYEMENTLKQLAHAGMQSGTINLSDVGEMLVATSPSEMLVRLKQAEEERIRQQQEQQNAQIEAQKAQQNAQFQFEQAKHQMDLEKMDKEYQYKIQIEQMKLEDKANADAFNQYYNDENRNGVEDQVEIDTENIKAEVKRDEIASKEEMFYKELSQKKELELAKLKTQEKIARENAIKSRQNKSK